MSHILLRFAHYMSEYEGVLVPVKVFGRDFHELFSKPVQLSSFGTTLDGEFASGTYLIRMTLPSGETLSQTATVASDENLEVEFKPETQSPREELSFAYYLQRSPHLGARKAETLRPSRTSQRPVLRFWERSARGWTALTEWTPKKMSVQIQPLGRETQIDQFMVYVFLTFSGEWREFPAQIWMQVDMDGASVISPIPAVSRITTLISRTPTPDGVVPFRVQSSNGNPTADALLNFVNSGDFQSARDIGSDWVDQAEDLLLQKIADPMSATVAGYFLLQAGAYERLHEWTANLANWFKWLPDGPIIRACHLMTRLNPDPLILRGLLLESVSRGLPFYTVGLRLLQSRLKLLLQLSDDDRQVAEALNLVSKYVEASDYSSALVNFTGSSPAYPEPFGRDLWVSEAAEAPLEFGETEGGAMA